MATRMSPAVLSRNVRLLPSILSRSSAFSRFSSSSDGFADFGNVRVPAASKAALVGSVFQRVARSYDVMNDLMSVGIHRLWKEYFVSRLNLIPGVSLLDVAGGTGDISFRILETLKAAQTAPAMKKLTNTKTSFVTISDINPAMLEVGRERARALGYWTANEETSTALKDSGIALNFLEGNAEKFPQLQEKSLDIYTIAFGLRNVTNIDAALLEAYRLLKPGGQLAILEFSHLTNPLLQRLYDQYSFTAIPAMGELVANDRASYQYLVESIRKFPTQEALKLRLERAGFQAVSYENLSQGIAAIHSAFRLD